MPKPSVPPAMRRLPILAGCAAALAAAGPASGPSAAMFPGALHSVSAPDGSGARIFYRPHLDRDGGQAHPVFYDDGHGHRSRIGAVTRSMWVSWSPDGKRAVLEDYWGSDIADCQLLTRSGAGSNDGITGISLLKIIQRTPGHPSGAEKPYESHYYVHCDRWLSPTRVAGSVSGHTDTEPSHDFAHPFTYDMHTRRLRWR